ncbi:hypothetical protein ACFQ51_16210 [Streptomyces kaempferi]
MRPRPSLPPVLNRLPLAPAAAAPALGLALALVLAPTPAHARVAPAVPGPTCAAPDTRAFPVKTRIHGGPGSFEAGGGFGTWYIDLTNTTAHTCGDIHPVVVLVDGKRALRPKQTRMEFFEGEKPHPVTFETSDEDENVGAFDDGFPGFTVGPGRTVTVKVRLSVTSDAVPNDVVANAAVVQRRGDDGNWVGESNDYRFRIDGGDGDVPGTAENHGRTDGGGTGGGGSGGGDGGGVAGATVATEGGVAVATEEAVPPPTRAVAAAGPAMPVPARVPRPAGAGPAPARAVVAAAATGGRAATEVRATEVRAGVRTATGAPARAPQRTSSPRPVPAPRTDSAWRA